MHVLQPGPDRGRRGLGLAGLLALLLHAFLLLSWFTPKQLSGELSSTRKSWQSGEHQPLTVRSIKAGPAAAAPQPVDSSPPAQTQPPVRSGAAEHEHTELELQEQEGWMWPRYPDALPPGGRLRLRWLLNLNPQGQVDTLESDAGPQTPEIFVETSRADLHAMQFSPEQLGLPILPKRICLEISFAERVEIRRLTPPERCLREAAR